MLKLKTVYSMPSRDIQELQTKYQLKRSTIITTDASKASTELILELLLKLTEKMDAMIKVTNPDVNPKTGKRYKRYC